MDAILVCYALGKLTPSERARLHKKLYGYKDHSNKGKYQYQRKGLLETIKHKKIMDCMIVAETETAGTLIKTLKEHKAKIHTFKINWDKKL